MKHGSTPPCDIAAELLSAQECLHEAVEALQRAYKKSSHPEIQQIMRSIRVLIDSEHDILSQDTTLDDVLAEYYRN